MSGQSHANVLRAAIAVALLACGCGPSTVPTPRSTPTRTPTPSLAPGVIALTAGRHALGVFGAYTYPHVTVVVPAGWYNLGGNFVDPNAEAGPRPILGLSVWDVGEVYHDPCHWHGQGFDPGPSVQDLVTALVAQKMRNATAPTDMTLAGYAGKYLVWSVPADLKSSVWTSFDACDLDADGTEHDFLSWLGNGMGDRYEEVPGQVDQLWSSTSTGSDWSLTPATHPTPPKPIGLH